MKECHHEYTAYKYDCDGLPDPLELEYLECLDCGEWLPLGPSSDDSPEVRCEIRAAEIAADWDRFCGDWRGLVSAGSCSDLDAVLGMVAACDRDIAAGRIPQQRAADIADLWTGYLARCISSHATTEGE